ncbi:MAG TPA: protoheme IX farnesyltransferase [Candidatus Acidoferrales bacterium]|nr:protoheme IX farnesyltransferase [Candidatus Acidoferrales bacterium]
MTPSIEKMQPDYLIEPGKSPRHATPADIIGANVVLSGSDLLSALLELVKIRITFFVGMSAIFGYVLAANEISTAMILPILGIFLLSCGSAAFNHYQERDTDLLMHRTSKRPLPSGTMSPQAVLCIVFGLSLAGSALILFTGNATSLILSLLAFVSYNAIYTPLKKVTPFAVIPGSFVGSFPVMAGWAEAGGYVFDPRLIVITAFFFIWQIPHFWLLMDMYSADYERANFPTLRMYFSARTLSVLTYLWIVIMFLTSAFFVITEVVNNIPTQVAIAALGLWLVIGTRKIISNTDDKRANKSAFMKINIYVLAITLVVMVDRVLSLPWRMF